MRRLIALALASALALAGCSSASSDPSSSASNVGQVDAISVGSSDALAPSLEFEPGLDYPVGEHRVEWDGGGAALQDGQPLLLDIYAESLDDHTPLINTYDGLPRSFLLAPEVVGQELYDILIALNVGARVVQVAPAGAGSTDEPPVALVIDVLSDRAEGTAAQANPDLPAVTLSATGEPTIEIPDTDPPSDLKVSTLVQGAGPQITSGSFVTVNYVGVYWGDGSNADSEWSSGDIFESSWPAEQAPFETQIGVGQVVTGWDQALIDITAGSQVEIVVPSAFGYPDVGTLVFVVDVLDVWKPEN